MTGIVVLDAGPLSLVTHPMGGTDAQRCHEWFRQLVKDRVTVYVPEIADYEVRRELIRAGKTNSVKRLDQMKTIARYLPIDTQTMLHAAELWARARNLGKPTASENALDADMILCAQTNGISADPDDVIIATTNVAHLSLFAKAAEWNTINSQTPPTATRLPP